MKKIILASGSVYRARALTQLGLEFKVESANIDESAIAGELPHQVALRLAHAKASKVAQHHTDAVIIGADQVGECNGRRLHKPGDSDTAVGQLCKLSGQHAEFFSAVVVHDLKAQRTYEEVVTTRLQFRAFSPAEARNYVALDQPFDCAGGFKVESAGIALFSHVAAEDPSALIGLPMIALLKQLAACDINPLQPA